MDEQHKTWISLPARMQKLGLEEACVVQIYGGELGKRYTISRELKVGRDQTSDVVLDMDNVSRTHAHQQIWSFHLDRHPSHQSFWR